MKPLLIKLFTIDNVPLANRKRYIWDGELRRIDINESDTEPLVGMGLLYGYRMQLDVIEGGTVTIQALSSLS
ncbi:hypothetical protein myaer87_31520 [Microcystis aeruginosa NIES-87]|nr:hypothetical protein myaer87_31520 [Microcystis aeruginosa NIES-87]